MTSSTPEEASDPLTSWGLSATAAWLAGPFETAISTIVNTREVEVAFIGRSWIHSHALLAVIDFRQPVGAELDAIRHDFLSLRPMAFVGKWSGLNTPGLGRAFNKLGPQRPPGRGIYRALLHLLSDAPVGARVIRQAPKLSFHYIRNLNLLPDRFRNHGIEHLEIVSSFHVRRAAAVVSLLTENQPLASDNQRQILNCLLNDYYEHAGDLLAQSHFHSPPWPGTPHLRPIANHAELEAAAKQFKNCARTLAADSVKGIVALYIWQDEELAMVELTKLTANHWVCSQILGIGNEPVSELTEEKIMETFPAYLVLGAGQ